MIRDQIREIYLVKLQSDMAPTKARSKFVDLIDGRMLPYSVFRPNNYVEIFGIVNLVQKDCLRNFCYCVLCLIDNVGYGKIVQVFGDDALSVHMVCRYLTFQRAKFVGRFVEIGVDPQAVLDAVGKKAGWLELADPDRIPMTMFRLKEFEGVADRLEGRSKLAVKAVDQWSDSLRYEDMLRTFKPETSLVTVYNLLHRRDLRGATFGRFKKIGIIVPPETPSFGFLGVKRLTIPVIAQDCGGFEPRLKHVPVAESIVPRIADAGLMRASNAVVHLCKKIGYENAVKIFPVSFSTVLMNKCPSRPLLPRIIERFRKNGIVLPMSEFNDLEGSTGRDADEKIALGKRQYMEALAGLPGLGDFCHTKVDGQDGDGFSVQRMSHKPDGFELASLDTRWDRRFWG